MAPNEPTEPMGKDPMLATASMIQYDCDVTGAQVVVPALYMDGFMPPRNSSEPTDASLKENWEAAAVPCAINCDVKTSDVR